MKKPIINFDDFMKLDIRVGEVTDAKAVEGSKKLLELYVDFGEDYGKTTVLAGVAEFYEPEKLIGKKFLFVANLAPRPMMGKVSQGMMLAADRTGKPFILNVKKALTNGTVIR